MLGARRAACSLIAGWRMPSTPRSDGDEIAATDRTAPLSITGWRFLKVVTENVISAVRLVEAEFAQFPARTVIVRYDDDSESLGALGVRWNGEAASTLQFGTARSQVPSTKRPIIATTHPTRFIKSQLISVAGNPKLITTATTMPISPPPHSPFAYHPAQRLTPSMAMERPSQPFEAATPARRDTEADAESSTRRRICECA